MDRDGAMGRRSAIAAVVGWINKAWDRLLACHRAVTDKKQTYPTGVPQAVALF